ncbi:MAG: F0F1 ATP synthase subunit A [Bacteroidota bacterium]|nr:F0F1 ATP synthase subunit A [Bacteroidota bacterium]
MNPFKQLFILIYFLLFFVPINVFAVESSESNDKDKLDIGGMIMHHILDDYQYEIMHGVVIPLPIILYTDNEGLIIFSSSNLFDENHEPIKEGYRGFYYDHGHIAPVDKSLSYIDFSITKNVFFLFLNASLMLFVFLSVASKYRNKKTTPKGIQSLFEPIIIFIRDDIVKPNIGEKYERYLPYMLTLFFFIFFGNVLGLFPAAANLTGNIAVTMVLALLTFLITNFSGNLNYWKHIFWTPNVPNVMRIIILPIEIIGVFTKPFSLMIRLFVAITAGHIVLLSFIGMTFIFGSYFVGVMSSLFAVALNIIELLVAGIQAYVFTMFSSVYIGLAVEEGHH